VKATEGAGLAALAQGSRTGTVSLTVQQRPMLGSDGLLNLAEEIAG
jgi:hypothetical protein